MPVRINAAAARVHLRRNGNEGAHQRIPQAGFLLPGPIVNLILMLFKGITELFGGRTKPYINRVTSNT